MSEYIIGDRIEPSAQPYTLTEQNTHFHSYTKEEHT